MTITEIGQRVDKIYITEKEFKKIVKWGKEKLVVIDNDNKPLGYTELSQDEQFVQALGNAIYQGFEIKAEREE